MQIRQDDDPIWWDDEVCLMAVHLGYDEGGADDILLVSVQMTVTEQARKLKRQWRSALGNVQCFHSKDLCNFTSGVFTAAGLNRKQREQLLKDLRKIIHRHLALGVTAKISKKLYGSLTTNEFRSRWGTAYSFAINMLMLCAYLEFTVARDESKYPWPPIDVNVLIEDGHRHAKQALGIVQDGKNLPKEHRFVNVLTAGLGSKIDNPILQAADMLAYAEWRDISQRDSLLNCTLDSPTSHYRTARFECTAELIEEITKGPEAWMKRRRDHWHNKTRANS
jgi:hypothetical protein